MVTARQRNCTVCPAGTRLSTGPRICSSTSPSASPGLAGPPGLQQVMSSCSFVVERTCVEVSNQTLVGDNLTR